MAVTEVLLKSFYIGSYLTYFLLGVAFVITIYHYWFSSLRYVKMGNKLPGVTPILPVIGNAHLAYNKSPVEFMDLIVAVARKTGKVVRVWALNRLYVGLLDPRDIELILGSQVHLEKSEEYDFFQPWLGDGLLINKGEKWRSHRKMIAPTFHQSILKTFVPIFNKNSRDVVQQLRREVLGKVCDVHDYMSEATVNILLETVMGVKRTHEDRSSFKYAKAVMDMCNILHLRHTKFWLRPNIIFRFTKWFKEQKGFLDTIHSLTNNVIKLKKNDYFERVQKGEYSLYDHAVQETESEARSSMNGHNFGTGLRDDLDDNDESIGEKKRLAFLDFMIEASQVKGNNLSDEEIKDEVNTIMFEGHDTTAAASSFFLCMLGVHQEIQERVYQEIKDIFQETNRTITFNDTLEMKYLTRVLLETLRLYPPVPVITRVVHEDVKLASSGAIIPAGATVGIGTYLVHRDADYFPNPEKFDPDNFLPERCQKRHYYSFIPFSAGPRSCVGRKYAMLKLKILLADLVRNFRITSVVGEEDFKLQGDIILKRSDGFRIILEERGK